MHDTEFLIEWGTARPEVRAMLLTGSLASTAPYIDALSDIDVILALSDREPFYRDRGWLSDFGPVLAAFQDPILPGVGLESWGYIVQYESGLKIDFSLWTVEMMRRLAAAPELPVEFDAGYRVLLDKDGLMDGIKPPTYQGYIPKPPTPTEYHEKIENFFLDACYVAKFLWRDDLIAAKEVLDHFMKQENLIPMLEWRSEIDHGWSVKPGPIGRRLKQWINADLWTALEQTYTGLNPDENWQALDRTINLMRRVAVEVGQHLGYAYPHEMDTRTVAYIHRIKAGDV